LNRAADQAALLIAIAISGLDFESQPPNAKDGQVKPENRAA
jgi:hypothetical protein